MVINVKPWNRALGVPWAASTSCSGREIFLTEGTQIITCQVTGGNGTVMAAVNTSSLSYNAATQQPIEWHHPDWNIGTMGTLYHTEIDDEGNIYAPTSSFTMDPLQAIRTLGIGGRGAIYKVDGVTGDVSVWANLPNAGTVGLGGIAYDKECEKMYVANYNNDKIYQLDLDGSILDSLTVPNPFGMAIYDEIIYITVHLQPGYLSLYAKSLADCNESGFPSGSASLIMHTPISSAVPLGDPDLEAGYAADIDFSIDGKMAIGMFTLYKKFFHANEFAMFNHMGPALVFENNGSGWQRTIITTVGQEPVIGTWNSANVNATSTGAVAWARCNDTQEDILWFSGGDFLGEDSNWGVIGYDVNQLNNSETQETASNYIQYLYSNGDPFGDPKGLGGTVTIFSGPTINATCSTCSISNSIAYDWGDAPDTYLTDSTGTAGPNHILQEGLFMGAYVDAEGDGHPVLSGADALGDDQADSTTVIGTKGSLTDDEDGISSFAMLSDNANSYSVDVTVTDTTGSDAVLIGWIDFDGSGTFEADEADSIRISDGSLGATVTLNWTVPVDITTGLTYARFRLTTDTLNVSRSTPGGSALDGEVEDYELLIKNCPTLSLSTSPDNLCSGDSSLLTLQFEAAGGNISIYQSTTLLDSATLVSTGHGGANLLDTTLTSVVINEVHYTTGDTVELWNNGCETVDISSWWLCSGFAYDALNTLTIISGDLNLSPNEKVVFTDFSSISMSAAADLGLYNTNTFTSIVAMEDFIQWGASGLGRESVAAAKGIWTTGDFIAAATPSNSLQYDGYGNTSTDWAENTSTLGSDNTNLSNPLTDTFSTGPLTNATSSPITYYYYAILSDGNCLNGMTCAPYVVDSVIVNPAPSIIGRDTSVCNGEVVDLSNLINGSPINTLEYGTSFGIYGSTNPITPVITSTYFIRDSSAISGCVDTAMVIISILDTIQTPISQDICQGSSFSFNSQTLTTAGTYRDTLTRTNGCDSFIVLILNVNPLDTTPLSHNICDGGSFFFNGQNLSLAGLYLDTLTDINGCDSLLELTLSTNPSDTTQLNQSICQGSSFSFNNQNLNTAGIYYDTLSNTNSCDSILELSLTVLDTIQTPISQDICQGNSFNFNSQNLTTAGTYRDTLSRTNGCDSFIVLTLNVHPEPSILGRDTSICSGQSLDLSTMVSGVIQNSLEYGTDFSFGGDSLVNPLISQTYFVRDSNILTACVDTVRIQVQILSCDWGDLPDTSVTTNIDDYQTINANNGPVHVIISGLSLGSSVDGETDGQSSNDALGDGTDENGLEIWPSLDLVPGLNFRLPFSYTNTTSDTAHVEAWIDWNGDGDFDDAGEMVVDTNDGAGTTPLANILPFSIPTTAATNTLLGLRIRISHQDNMTPYGMQPNGEIEDYLIGIDCPQVCFPIQSAVRKK